MPNKLLIIKKADFVQLCITTTLELSFQMLHKIILHKNKHCEDLYCVKAISKNWDN